MSTSEKNGHLYFGPTSGSLEYRLSSLGDKKPQVAVEVPLQAALGASGDPA